MLGFFPIIREVVSGLLNLLKLNVYLLYVENMCDAAVASLHNNDIPRLPSQVCSFDWGEKNQKTKIDFTLSFSTK